MRTTRSHVPARSAALGLALAGLLLGGPSAAGQGRTPAASDPATRMSVAVAEGAEERPRRAVTIRFRLSGESTFRFVGAVEAARKKRIRLVRSDTRRGGYQPVRSTRTDQRGRYRLDDLRRTGYYAVKVPGDRRFATSYSTILHVHYD